MTTPHTRTAPHVDEQWTDVVELLTDAMRTGHALCHLGQYTGGCDDVLVDMLDEPAEDHVHPDRDEYVRIGRRLSLQVGELDAELLPARTGSLIRTVLHASAAVVHLDSVVLDQQLIGFASVNPPPGTLSLPEVPSVRDSDHLVSALAETLREQMSLGSRNPGGWRTERPDDEDLAATVPVADTSTIRAHGAARGPHADLCRKVIDPRDVHYVAMCRNAEAVFAFDCFDDRHMGRLFNRLITSEDRRAFYSAFCGTVAERVAQLGRAANRVLEGPVRRMVLDVEQGAIYYYRLRAGDYLVGVTLKQTEVANADRAIARLAGELAGL